MQPGWKDLVMSPYRDENQTQRFAIVTGAIIGMNVISWLMLQGAGSDLPLAASVCNLGLIPGELTGLLPAGSKFSMGPGLVCETDPGRQAAHLMTSMFLHGSWMHLIGNMWFLWIFGNNVEDSMGRLRFIAFYLLTGLAAALGQVITNPDSAIPMVGASGAISGVMGAYLVLYPRVKVYALIPIFIVFTSIALPAWAMLGYWFLIQFASGLFAIRGEAGVAFWAHIGGFVAGVVLIKFFARGDYVQAHRSHHWRPQRLMRDV
jgi:membrane associated rhomboid family serine protease